MISRTAAEDLIAEALREAGVPAMDARRKAAGLVDRIYGALGADAFNPRGEIPAGYEAD